MVKSKLSICFLRLFIFSVLFFLFSPYLLLSPTGKVNQSVKLVDRRYFITSDQPHAVLLPAWEALVLSPPHDNSDVAHSNMMCQFQNGATSPAFFGGVVPSSGRAVFRCLLPNSMRRIRPFLSPCIIPANISTHSSSNSSEFDSDSAPEMLRWIQLVYDAVTTPLDVLVFAKGLNTRSGRNLPASDVDCVYFSVADGRVADYEAISSAQEVFRCPHPSSMDLNFLNTSSVVRISLAIGADKTLLPSLATYTPPRAPVQDTETTDQSLICACTMVYNVAKFVKEWVVYHDSIGVEKFILYDNGSEDELGPTVSQLLAEGYDMETYYWPWPKTQESGFSHCAAMNKQNCRWMAFIDVDEFVFSPAWATSDRPDHSMLTSLVESVGNEVGQINILSHEFGPSGLRTHPNNSVTQGYTCRRKSAERHKSLVLLRAVDRSLVNSVYHFKLKDGFKTEKLPSVHINHYKYQVWEEFRMKFRRRVSAYVVDWKEQANLGSQDRTPGLGFEPVEPDNWAYNFCEVNDTVLRDVTRRWFSTKETDGKFKLKWERI